MRCQYCMPAEGIHKLQRAEILSYDQLYRIAAAAVSVGIEKIRVTGGEPLIRKGLTGFLSRLAGIPGLKQLVLTTNGILLAEMADELRSAGVQRLNISLDSLKPKTFAQITRGADLERVLSGIAAAERCGFPIKINMVVMRGINDDEVVDFASLAANKPYTVRFIEYMPAIKEGDWRSLTVPGRQILERIKQKYSFEPIKVGDAAGPAQEFRISGGIGAFGIITPIYGHFCATCNRIRVTSTGVARSCLFSTEKNDLKPHLGPRNSGALQNALRKIVAAKPGKHEITGCRSDQSQLDMFSIGG